MMIQIVQAEIYWTPATYTQMEDLLLEISLVMEAYEQEISNYQTLNRDHPE